jgi:hypothetical protein
MLQIHANFTAQHVLKACEKQGLRDQEWQIWISSGVLSQRHYVHFPCK